MKSQTRPFAAETMKSAQPASLGGRPHRDEHEDFMETFPDDVPERDIHADLADSRDDDWDAAAPVSGSPADAPGADARGPAPPEGGAAVEERVQESVGEPEPAGEPVPQASRTRQPAARTEPLGDTVSPAADEPPASLEEPPRTTEDRRSAPQGAPPRLRRRSRPLPRGQRWKERRLPRVCWDR